MIARIKEKTEKSVKTSDESLTSEKAKADKNNFNLNLKEMTEAGLFFGHRTSRIHPKMKPYISGVRNTAHIIDLEKTLVKFKEALKFIESLVSSGKILMFVGTKIQIKKLVKETASQCGFPYVNERWLGGAFTNFKTIKKRIEYFKNLEKKKAGGELNKYTKKEKAKIDKELNDLDFKIGGIKDLEKLPDAVFILDMKKDALAVKEARKKGIPVIALSDTNTDPALADYPIPANDDAISSVKYILDKVKETILKAKSKT